MLWEKQKSDQTQVLKHSTKSSEEWARKNSPRWDSSRGSTYPQGDDENTGGSRGALEAVHRINQVVRRQAERRNQMTSKWPQQKRKDPPYTRRDDCSRKKPKKQKAKAGLGNKGKAMEGEDEPSDMLEEPLAAQVDQVSHQQHQTPKQQEHPPKKGFDRKQWASKDRCESWNLPTWRRIPEA